MFVCVVQLSQPNSSDLDYPLWNLQTVKYRYYLITLLLKTNNILLTNRGGFTFMSLLRVIINCPKFCLR